MSHLRRVAPLCLVAGLALAGPDEAATFRSELAAGEAKTFPLKAAKGFWSLSLRAPVDEVDLDLSVEVAGERRDVSQAEGAFEELIVPGHLPQVTATVEHFDGPRCAFELAATPLAPGKRLALGKAVQGALDGATSRWAVHELPATGSSYALVSLSAQGEREGADWDLYLYGEDWRLLATSTEEGAEEQLIVSPSRAARWLVVHALAGEAAYALEAQALGADARKLGAEERVAGELEPGGEAWFRLRTGQPGIVTVRLAGPDGRDLDLQVWGPDGYYRESAAEGSEEELAINGARRGDYLVRVASDQDHGAFELVTDRLDISKLARSGKPGQVWALFVGIANYQEVESLTYSGGDALLVYQTLRAAGQVDARHSLVLLDELARREDVAGALAELAKRAGEDDVLLFFYSGHGGNDAPDGERGDAKDERVSGDEYLVCQDSTAGDVSGDLVDDDLKALLDAVPCRRQLLFIDACHAGGFAELVDRDGRYGCFSSLEEQTSSEALGLKRGHQTAILVRALQGEADQDGDGRVTLGEVSAFVLRVQPLTCAGCQGPIGEAGRRCRRCGVDLSTPEGRQVPVIVNRADPGYVLAGPARRGRR